MNPNKGRGLIIIGVVIMLLTVIGGAFIIQNNTCGGDTGIVAFPSPRLLIFELVPSLNPDTGVTGCAARVAGSLYLEPLFVGVVLTVVGIVKKARS